MGKKSLNKVLAENLAREMRDRGFSEKKLGAKAGISPRTVANYLNDSPAYTSGGKERSAKLAEIDKLADALEISAIILLSDPQDIADHAREVAKAVTDVMRRPPLLLVDQSDAFDMTSNKHQTDEEVRAARKAAAQKKKGPSK